LLLGKSFKETESYEEAATQYMLALWSAESQIVSPDQVIQLRGLYPSWIEAESKLTDINGKKDLCNTIQGLLERKDWQEKIIQTREELKVDNKQGMSTSLGEIFSQPNGAFIVCAITNINQFARAGYLRTAMEEAYFSLQSAPAYLPLHMYMGEVLLREDRLPDAIAKFSTIAHTYQARGETDQAILILRRVKKIAPMDQQSRRKLIILLKERGETEAVIDEYIELAEVYYSVAELSQARQTYQEAYLLTHQASSNPELETQLLYKIADIDMQSLDWRSALDIYTQIRTINPDDGRARQKIVELVLRLGNPSEAESEIDEYISYLNFAGDQDKALEFLKRLAHENPSQLFIWYRLADFYQKLGRNKDAINELDKLGKILIDAGDQAAAAQVIERIIALEPENIDHYEAMLTQLQ
jgi:tetratricopeptide (TPR) repeat protein